MDTVYRRFLENSHAAGVQLAAESDVLDLFPVWPYPPRKFLFEFHLPYLRCNLEGTVEVAPGPIIGVINFPETYLRSVDTNLPFKIVSVKTRDLTHPNIRGTVVCLGRNFRPGTPIQALLWNLWDILTYQNCSLDERNAMNSSACRLLRACPEMLTQLPQSRLLRKKQSLDIQFAEDHR